jgi:hypothetical protein
VVAIVLGVIGLRRAGEHPTGQGRGSSVAGIVLGVLGTLASIAAFAIVALFVASSDFEISDTRPAAPDDYELSDRTCRVENRQAVAGGVLTNTSEGEPGFVITVRFLDGQRVLDTATDELAANLGHDQSWDWEVAIPVDPQQVNTDSLECRVERVDLARLVD